jgi:alpha-ketoglutarate-dependent taurine dioxygenase
VDEKVALLGERGKRGMKNGQSTQPGSGKLSIVKRRVVSTTSEEWVKAEPLTPDCNLPLLIQPAFAGVDLIAWAKGNREFLEAQVLKHGAVLFRNFEIKSIGEFENFIAAVSAGAIEYRYRASPRTRVSGNIYTSTEYPADQTIFPHNEHAYSPVFPLRIFFHCVTPAEQGGETPLGDGRRIFQRISPQTVQRFIEKQVMYVRNYNDGFGLPWQTVFQTTDRAVVEEYGRRHGIQVEWKDSDRLRTRQVGPAVVRHPHTGEPVWFNHATFFHVSTLAPELRDGVLATFTEEDYPTNTYYGDGTPIETAVLQELREVYRQELNIFPWQRRDVLMVDNMLTVHGRRPFVGPRKVVVGMAEPTSWQDVQIERASV